MRLALITGILSICLAASDSLAQTPQQMSFEGPWLFTWDNDSKNTNTGNLKQGVGTISGTYINDAKDKCPIAGRMASPTVVQITIVCPQWEIRAQGSITNPQLVVGDYVAYGSSKGAFQMSRK